MIILLCQEMHNHKKFSIVGPTSSYSSRGHLMLQAALRKENKIKNITITSTTYQQRNSTNSKKKIRRKSVNFRDPVVDSKHVYEQILYCDMKLLGEDQQFRTADESPSKNEQPVPPIRKKHTLKRKRVNDQTDDESLFSSPKVAKIIPYYQDKFDLLDAKPNKIEKACDNEIKNDGECHMQQSQQHSDDSQTSKPQEFTQLPVNDPQPPADRSKLTTITNFFSAFAPTKWFLDFLK